MLWHTSFRADPAARQLADRHYNRQSVGAAQFVPPGACVVLRTACNRAAWVTLEQRAEFVDHAWPNAWLNCLFRNEGAGLSSMLIRQAVAAQAYSPAVNPVTAAREAHARMAPPPYSDGESKRE